MKHTFFKRGCNSILCERGLEDEKLNSGSICRANNFDKVKRRDYLFLVDVLAAVCAYCRSPQYVLKLFIHHIV
jgi:hypothetical protein